MTMRNAFADLATDAKLDEIKAAIDQLRAMTLTDDQLRGNPVPVADGTASAYLWSLNEAAASNANQNAEMVSLQASIKTLNDTMLYMLSAMLEKMPRLDSADRVMARVVINGENDLNSPHAGIAVNSTGNPSTGAQFYRTYEPWNFSDAGSARIYQQIQVTP